MKILKGGDVGRSIPNPLLEDASSLQIVISRQRFHLYRHSLGGGVLWKKIELYLTFDRGGVHVYSG